MTDDAGIVAWWARVACYRECYPSLPPCVDNKTCLISLARPVTTCSRAGLPRAICEGCGSERDCNRLIKRSRWRAKGLGLINQHGLSSLPVPARPALPARHISFAQLDDSVTLSAAAIVRYDAQGRARRVSRHGETADGLNSLGWRLIPKGRLAEWRPLARRAHASSPQPIRLILLACFLPPPAPVIPDNQCASSRRAVCSCSARSCCC